MANIDLNVTPGQTKTLTFNTADKYNTENIVFNLTSTQGNATQSVAGLMSAADKIKLDGISTDAGANVQSDWNETDINSDAFIKNKPTLQFGTSTCSLSNGIITVTPSGGKRTYQVFETTSTFNTIRFIIPDSETGFEHYVLVANGSRTAGTIRTITNFQVYTNATTSVSNVYYPEDYEDYSIGINEALEISCIRQGNTAVITLGGLYKK